MKEERYVTQEASCRIMVLLTMAEIISVASLGLLDEEQGKRFSVRRKFANEFIKTQSSCTKIELLMKLLEGQTKVTLGKLQQKIAADIKVAPKEGSLESKRELDVVERVNAYTKAFINIHDKSSPMVKAYFVQVIAPIKNLYKSTYETEINVSQLLKVMSEVEAEMMEAWELQNKEVNNA